MDRPKSGSLVDEIVEQGSGGHVAHRLWAGNSVVAVERHAGTLLGFPPFAFAAVRRESCATVVLLAELDGAAAFAALHLLALVGRLGSIPLGESVSGVFTRPGLLLRLLEPGLEFWAVEEVVLLLIGHLIGQGYPAFYVSVQRDPGYRK